MSASDSTTSRTTLTVKRGPSKWQMDIPQAEGESPGVARKDIVGPCLEKFHVFGAYVPGGAVV